MSLPVPNLDDRSFEQLVREALDYLVTNYPDSGWNDLSPSDPGRILLELFAYLTERMIYRLNQVPYKVYVEFLQLLGVRLNPPAAAEVLLQFSRPAAQAAESLRIPRGVRVTTNRTTGSDSPPVFSTTRAVEFRPGETTVSVQALHGEQIEGELLGVGTGKAGLSLSVARPPIIASAGDSLDLLIGIEVVPTKGETAALIEYQGKTYLIWQEVRNFIETTTRMAYIADRATGTIVFAPAIQYLHGADETPKALADIPPKGREIRAWYKRGGGVEGNVPANSLTTLKDPVPGVSVTNPERATGGRPAESLPNALVRGPQELHALERAITARDFEQLALNVGGVSRALAQALAARWVFATPGTVQVLLVPELPPQDRTNVTAADLIARQTDVTRSSVQALLEDRKPLGMHCAVAWARYKTVKVTARVIVRKEENPQSVQARLLTRLHEMINPLDAEGDEDGWPFGQALRVSSVYNVILAEAGVRWIDEVRLSVDDAPQDVSALAADPYQPQTWYGGSSGKLYRSVNDGASWERVRDFGAEQVVLVRPHPDRPGLLAISTHRPHYAGSHLYFSRECGESWEQQSYETDFIVNDAVWITRNDVPILLLATDAGLYELTPVISTGLELPSLDDVLPDEDAEVLEATEPASVAPLRTVLLPILVDQSNPTLGFYSIAAISDLRGITTVALAAQRNAGVYLSRAGGRANSFRNMGRRGDDIRVVAFQPGESGMFLWAGTASEGGDPSGKDASGHEAFGFGCWRIEMRTIDDPSLQWSQIAANWTGGTCRGLVFKDGLVFAATHRGGVLRCDATKPAPAWEAASVATTNFVGTNVQNSLPLRDPGQSRYLPVVAIAINPAHSILMAGGEKGIFASQDSATSFAFISGATAADSITLPGDWLLVSGDHEIEVISEDERR